MKKIINAETAQNNPPSSTDRPPANGPDWNTISQAAKILGCLPKELIGSRRKKPRTWTGIVNGKRMWMERKVILPEGGLGWIVEVQGGMAKVLIGMDEIDDSPICRYVAAAALTVWRRPEAVLLGTLKTGVKERKSLKKLASSQRNGSLPVKPGSRPRGRPGKRQPLIAASAIRAGRRGPYKTSLKRLMRRMFIDSARNRGVPRRRNEANLPTDAG